MFSNATLHWVHDHLAVLEGITRALGRSGRMLLHMGGAGNAIDADGFAHVKMVRLDVEAQASARQG